MVIQHNLSAMNSHRQLGINNTSTSKNLEKLSSGYKVNRAGDDAAGLAISEKMRGQIRGLEMANQNAQNGVSLIQTAEGGLNEIHAILQRMRELAVQSANGTYMDDVDRESLTKETDALKAEIDRIASSTHYNGINLLDGTMGSTLYSADNHDEKLISIITDLGIYDASEAPQVNILNIGSAMPYGEFRIIITKNDDGVKMALQVGDKTYVSDNNRNFRDEDGNNLAFFSRAISEDNVKTNGVLNCFKYFEVEGTKTVSYNKSELIFQIGANGTADQRVGLHIDDMSTATLGDTKSGKLICEISIGTREKANEAINVIDGAINKVSGTRADLGALQNRLEHTINNLGTTTENLQAAESTIRDVDMAKEMMEFTKNNILVQASQSMLAQANQMPQGVLSLLR